jgi:hypothetical protein
MIAQASYRPRATVALILFLVTACGGDLRPLGTKRSETPAPSNGATEKSNRQTTDESRTKTADQKEREPSTETAWVPNDRLQLHDDARVQVNHTQVIPDAQLGIQVPVVEFSLKDADFVQVIRCKSDFVLRLPTGERITAESAPEPEQLKWAWHEAATATEFCRFTSIRSTLGRFEDAAVRDSEFFYILNPCILDPDAPDDESAAICSNRLAVTQRLTVDPTKQPAGTASGKLLDLALQAYSMARSKTEGQLTRLHVLSVRAEKLAQICKANQKAAAGLSAFWNGIGNLAGIAVTSAISSAGGIFAVPLIHGQVQALVRSLFASRVKLPPSCSQLESTLDTTQSVASEYENSLKELQIQADTLQQLRTAQSSKN